MGVNKIFRINKNLRRPRKTEAQHRQRTIVHKRRLVAMGFKEEQVAKLDSRKVRELLRKAAQKSTRGLIEKRYKITLRK